MLARLYCASELSITLFFFLRLRIFIQCALLIISHKQQWGTQNMAVNTSVESEWVHTYNNFHAPSLVPIEFYATQYTISLLSHKSSSWRDKWLEMPYARTGKWMKSPLAVTHQHPIVIVTPSLHGRDCTEPLAASALCQCIFLLRNKFECQFRWPPLRCRTFSIFVSCRNLCSIFAFRNGNEPTRTTNRNRHNYVVLKQTKRNAIWKEKYIKIELSACDFSNQLLLHNYPYPLHVVFFTNDAFGWCAVRLNTNRIPNNRWSHNALAKYGKYAIISLIMLLFDSFGSVYRGHHSVRRSFAISTIAVCAQTTYGPSKWMNIGWSNRRK